MITGTVFHRRPTVELTLRAPNGQERTIEFIVDTGFTGYLTLPSSVIAALSLPFVQYYRAALADGSVTRLEVYAVRVLWDGALRDTDALSTGGEPLLGMSLLDGSKVNLQAIDGGSVTIKPLQSV